MKSINSLTRHLKNFHKKEITSTQYWCELCNHFMTKNPKSHDCFRNISIYNVDFSKYTFPYTCDTCHFGANKKYPVTTHKCYLTPVHAPFPSSDPGATPPHQVFQNQTPQFSAQSQSDQQVTEEVLENNSRRSTQAPENTFPSRVSLVSEADITPSTSRREILNEVQGTASSVPTQVIEHFQASLTTLHDKLPGTFCRLQESNELHFIFPFKNYLSCTEFGCGGVILADNWSEANFNLNKHLVNVHKLPRPSNHRWCAKCKIQIPKIITKHECFNKGGYFKISKEVKDSQVFQFKCMDCKVSFPRKASLVSHSRMHEKDLFKKQHNITSLKEALKLRQLIPPQLQGTPPSSPHNSDLTSSQSGSWQFVNYAQLDRFSTFIYITSYVGWSRGWCSSFFRK